MDSLPVVGTSINTGNFQFQLKTLLGWATTRQSRMVCVANVHMVMEARKNKSFADILSQADWLTPDGMPLVWSMRLQGASGQERVSGMDLMPALCNHLERMNIPIFFLGSTVKVLSHIKKRLTAEYPNLQIAGMVSPPFRPLSAEEDKAITNQINASGAGLVLVSLGCPKQERWMHEHRGKVQAVMVGIGAAFPVFAGMVKRAPKWMQHLGLEWLHRLGQDPRRLWRRYIINNPAFIWNTFLQLTGLRKFETNRTIIGLDNTE